MTQITKEHLEFMQKAKEAFESDSGLYTFRNGTHDEDDTLIALRYGMDRDCILVYELRECVANFVQQMQPSSLPRKSVMDFANDMEERLKSNDFKGGWEGEHWCDLAMSLQINSENLRVELMKRGTTEYDPYQVILRAANIANYAMMIAENEGVRL